MPLNGATAKKVGKDLYLISALFDNARPDFAALKGDKLAAAKKAWEEEKDYEVVDELPFWFNGRGFINKKRNRIYLYNAKKKKLQALTEPLFDVGGVKFCSKCGKVAYTGHTFNARRAQSSALYLYDVETGETSCLVEDGTYSIGNFCFDNAHGEIVFSANPIRTAIRPRATICMPCPSRAARWKLFTKASLRNWAALPAAMYAMAAATP